MLDNKDNVVNLLLEFMEAVVHQVLYIREVYDPDLFERQKLYGVAVRKCRHPTLCDYIHDVIHSLKDPLSYGTLYKVAIVLICPDHQPVERHIIEPRVLVPQNPQQQTGATGLQQVRDAEAQLRGFILKLQYMDSYLEKPPPECTFEIVAYTAGRVGVAVDAWVEEQQGQPGALELGEGEIVPVKTCKIDGGFQLQMYTEREQP